MLALIALKLRLSFATIPPQPPSVRGFHRDEPRRVPKKKLPLPMRSFVFSSLFTFSRYKVISHRYRKGRRVDAIGFLLAKR